MATVNPTSGISYDPTLTSYNNDLALLNDSGLSAGSTGSTATPAYTLDSSLTSQTAAASSTGINPFSYSLPFAFSNPNLLSQLTPVELSYLMGLPTTQSTTAGTSAQPASEATQTDLYAVSPAGVNSLGDPLTWQIGDATLYQMDPALSSVINGPTSSDSSSAYTQSQDTASVGDTVDTSA